MLAGTVIDPGERGLARRISPGLMRLFMIGFGRSVQPERASESGNMEEELAEGWERRRIGRMGG